MMTKRAKRLDNMPSYPFAQWSKEVEAVRSQGTDIIRLDIGSPDMPPPAHVLQALWESAQNPEHHGYAGYRGIPGFRQAITAYYKRRFGVSLNPDNQVVPLIGSKEGIINTALALLDPGDKVLVPNPGYAPYTRGTVLVGAQPEFFPLMAENDFLPDLDAIPPAVADKAVLMWLNYPNNPTGAVASRDFFRRVIDFAHRHNVIICHDAPYCDVTYGDYIAPSILEIDGAQDVAVEFNSLSKTYNMAGWRLGFAVGNEELLAALAQVKSNVDSGMFRALQEAAIAAFSTPLEWVQERNAVYQERIELIVRTLNSIGLSATLPRATFYIWARIPGGEQATEFALSILKETGIAVAPGTFFGSAGEGYIRISATAPLEKIQEAMQRLRGYA